MKSFDLQPTLTGELLRLRPLAKEDFDELFQCASDPKIWEQHPQRDRFQKTIFQKFFDGGMASRGAFAVIELATGKIVGSSRFYDLNVEESRVTVGYTFLETRCWGGKFNRELKTLMLTHAFASVDLVIFEIGSDNRRSRKAIENIGAHLLKTEILDDNPHVVYGISQETFRQTLRQQP